MKACLNRSESSRDWQGLIVRIEMQPATGLNHYINLTKKTRTRLQGEVSRFGAGEISQRKLLPDRFALDFTMGGDHNLADRKFRLDGVEGLPDDL